MTPAQSADGLLFGAARELLGNVVKHAHARRATVTLQLHDDDHAATLVVADDGIGLAPTAPGPADGHIGLHSQELRIEAAGGSVTVAAGPTGTTATVVVPVTATR